VRVRWSMWIPIYDQGAAQHVILRLRKNGSREAMGSTVGRGRILCKAIAVEKESWLKSCVTMLP
jgi:hypothetical protein